MKIYDLSLVLDRNLLAYPGDPNVEIHQIAGSESEWNLTTICMSSHSGSHLDAPLHLLKNGIGIMGIQLERCMGYCKVLDLTSIAFGDKITRSHLDQYTIKKNDIILLKTKNSSILTQAFNSQFICLNEEGARYLVESDIKAVGIDYLSIGSKEVHEILLGNAVLIYETLNLQSVSSGRFYFLGLPLRVASEASPVRVILSENTPFEKLR